MPITVIIDERSTKLEIIDAVKENSVCLQRASEALRDDENVVRAAISHSGFSLQYASSRLRDHRDVVLDAVDNQGLALQYASLRLQNDRELVLRAINNCFLALQHTSENLKYNRSFFWDVYRIQNTNAEKFDEATIKFQKHYTNVFIALESIKLFGTLAVSGLFMAAVIALPIPSVAAIIFNSLLAGASGLYVANSIYQHAHGFFKATREIEQLPPALDAGHAI